jgi:hypothetical protein
LLAAPLLLTVPALAEAQAVGGRVEVHGMLMYYEVSGSGEYLGRHAPDEVTDAVALAGAMFIGWCRYRRRKNLGSPNDRDTIRHGSRRALE